MSDGAHDRDGVEWETPDSHARPGATTQQTSRRASVYSQLERMIGAIRKGDDATVESVIYSLSQRNRFLAPLTLVVGAFAMLFQGVKLLVTNWRLTLIQILPAMLIWLAMLDLKVHVLRGRSLNVIRGPILVPMILGVALVAAAAYFLNAVFAFSIADPLHPEIGPAYARARRHRGTVLGWGFVIGLALGFATLVSSRWGKGWFGLILGIVVGVMMVTYVAVPARIIGIKSDRSRRDKISATAIGGAIGAVVCSPPYVLGRVGIILLGTKTFFVLGVILLIIAIPLQTGAVTATKAVKFSAKLVTGQGVEVGGDADAGADPDAGASPESRASGPQPAAGVGSTRPEREPESAPAPPVAATVEEA